MGRLKPIKGSVSINGGLRIGHFTQHSSDNFDLEVSAVENLLNMFDEAEDQEIRSFLGKFQIQGNAALMPMVRRKSTRILEISVFSLLTPCRML